MRVKTAKNSFKMLQKIEKNDKNSLVILKIEVLDNRKIKTKNLEILYK